MRSLELSAYRESGCSGGEGGEGGGSGGEGGEGGEGGGEGGEGGGNAKAKHQRTQSAAPAEGKPKFAQLLTSSTSLHGSQKPESA